MLDSAGSKYAPTGFVLSLPFTSFPKQTNLPRTLRWVRHRDDADCGCGAPIKTDFSAKPKSRVWTAMSETCTTERAALNVPHGRRERRSCGGGEVVGVSGFHANIEQENRRHLECSLAQRASDPYLARVCDACLLRSPRGTTGSQRPP